MSTNRTHSRRNRTLLILLGILLAFLLTLNAKYLYAKELRSPGINTSNEGVSTLAPKSALNKIQEIAFKIFPKKVSSLD